MAYLEIAAALAMLVALYVGTEPKWWGWLLFAPLFLYIVARAVHTYRYSLTIDGDRITVVDLNKHDQYLVSEIAAINVWPAKGERVAVITFDDRKKLSFPSHLDGFDELVESLMEQSRSKLQT
ncbi:hypothetical protein [Sideroxydans lithotrophicus]|nr:hypothetical protein [Sideroxydans lithotrophicus]